MISCHRHFQQFLTDTHTHSYITQYIIIFYYVMYLYVMISFICDVMYNIRARLSRNGIILKGGMRTFTNTIFRYTIATH